MSRSMWIVRGLDTRLRRSAPTRPVVMLTGARQTGKTSTVRRLFPDLELVSRITHRDPLGDRLIALPADELA